MPAPGQFLPRASGPHRIACKALYRALLQPHACIPVPCDLLTQGPVNPIKHLIRKRFKQNVRLESSKLIVRALKVGYLAEKLLRHAAEGAEPAVTQIHAFLRAKDVEADAARKLCAQPPVRPRKHLPQPYPGAPKVVEVRPLSLEKISSGERHVPSLVLTSSGYPFLRFKKPQSIFLSRVIGNKIAQKQRWINQLQDLEEWWGWLGRQEQVWEICVLEQIDKEVLGGLEDGGNDEWWKSGWGAGVDEQPKWMTWVNDATAKVRRAMDLDKEKAKILGAKMSEIVLEEQRLYLAEKMEMDEAMIVNRPENRKEDER